ncbi:MAG: aminopeptidase [Burkholderiaceae bacterium]
MTAQLLPDSASQATQPNTRRSHVRRPAARPASRTFCRVLLLTLVCAGLTGCAFSGLGFYWQSVNGHLSLMQVSRPIEQVLADEAVSETIRDKLVLAREARRFAVTDLSLPDNGSYTGYADVERPYVLWNVFAASELSLKLKTWCFPVAGCVSYRGYYDKADATAYAEKLKADGFDVRVGGVPAYSTLGWFDDPIPSPVLRNRPTQIARLIFHELAHQVLYVKGDSGFNESFATAVEIVGVERWLSRQEAISGDQQPRVRYEAARQRKADFLALLRTARDRLQTVYESPVSDERKRTKKQEVIDLLRQEYQAIKQTKWDGFKGYDRWFAQPLGNAHLGAIGAYNDGVDAFLGMLDEVDGNLTDFYELASQVGALAPDERNARLQGYKQAFVKATDVSED